MTKDTERYLRDVAFVSFQLIGVWIFIWGIAVIASANSFNIHQAWALGIGYLVGIMTWEFAKK